MVRRFVLPMFVAAALACGAAAQSGGQEPPDAPTPQPSATQQPSANQQPAAAPADSNGPDQSKDGPDSQKKKDGWLKRTIHRAAPDCVNIGTSYCRDESKNDGSQGDEGQQSPIPQSQPIPRSGSHAGPGSSSSADTQIDLSPPPGDSTHPGAESDVTEFHPWDPHRAAKDIEVGDFYFKRDNYRAAESRYREALQFKPNDALATFRLAETLDREHNPEAKDYYQQYLKILPSGEFAQQAKDAIERLSKAPAGSPNTAKK